MGFYPNRDHLEDGVMFDLMSGLFTWETPPPLAKRWYANERIASYLLLYYSVGLLTYHIASVGGSSSGHEALWNLEKALRTSIVGCQESDSSE